MKRFQFKGKRIEDSREGPTHAGGVDWQPNYTTRASRYKVQHWFAGVFNELHARREKS